jgi:hypothetical protein
LAGFDPKARRRHVWRGQVAVPDATPVLLLQGVENDPFIPIEPSQVIWLGPPKPAARRPADCGLWIRPPAAERPAWVEFGPLGPAVLWHFLLAFQTVLEDKII